MDGSNGMGRASESYELSLVAPPNKIDAQDATIEIIVDIAVTTQRDVRDLIDVHLGVRDFVRQSGGRLTVLKSGQQSRLLMAEIAEKYEVLLDRLISRMIQSMDLKRKVGYAPIKIIRIRPQALGPAHSVAAATMWPRAANQRPASSRV